MTETVKHTPGPWMASPSIEFDFYGIYPATGQTEFPIAKMPDFIRSEIVQANARLIAAAPELLAALQLFVADAEDDANILPSQQHRLKLGRAALAKATSP